MEKIFRQTGVPYLVLQSDIYLNNYYKIRLYDVNTYLKVFLSHVAKLGYAEASLCFDLQIKDSAKHRIMQLLDSVSIFDEEQRLTDFIFLVFRESDLVNSLQESIDQLFLAETKQLEMPGFVNQDTPYTKDEVMQFIENVSIVACIICDDLVECELPCIFGDSTQLSEMLLAAALNAEKWYLSNAQFEAARICLQTAFQSQCTTLNEVYSTIHQTLAEASEKELLHIIYYCKVLLLLHCRDDNCDYITKILKEVTQYDSE